MALLGLGESTVATMIVGAVIGAAVGTVVAVAASAITQGINIGFGLQQEFDWKQFAGEIAGGVLEWHRRNRFRNGVRLDQGGHSSPPMPPASRVVAAIGVDVALQVAGEAVRRWSRTTAAIEHPGCSAWPRAPAIAGEVLLGALRSRAMRDIDGAKNTGGDAGQSTSEAVPTKRVLIADSPDVVSSKPVGDVGKATETGVVASLKKRGYRVQRCQRKRQGQSRDQEPGQERGRERQHEEL